MTGGKLKEKPVFSTWDDLLNVPHKVQVGLSGVTVHFRKKTTDYEAT